MILGLYLAVALCSNVLIRLVATEPGTALLRSRVGNPDAGEAVFLTGAYIVKGLDSWEKIDITLRQLDWEFSSLDRNGCEISGRVHFFLRIPRIEEKVKEVALLWGVDKANALEELEKAFRPRFQEAIDAVCARYCCEEIPSKRESFRDLVVELIGKELDGFHLEDAAFTDFQFGGPRS